MSRPPLTGHAGRVRAALLAEVYRLEALSDCEAYGPHRVFAGLYVETNRRLIACFEGGPAARFCDLVIVRFLELYDRHVARPVTHGGEPRAPHWRAYAALASRMTMASDPDALLRLLSEGARAHIRSDLAVAIALAVGDHRRLYGAEPDFAAARKVLLGRDTSLAFFDATLAFNAAYRRRTRGPARLTLIRHAVNAWLWRPVWLTVLQSWRRAAWTEAMARLGVEETRAHPRRPARPASALARAGGG